MSHCSFPGVLDAGEIKETLKRLGLEKISDEQVKQLLHK